MKFNKLITTLFIIVVILIGCDKKSERYTIKGTMSYKDIDSLYMYSVSEKTIDSVIIKDGKFTLTGSVDKPRKVIVGNFGKNLILNLILDNDDYTINFGKEYTSVSGGKAHNTIYGFYGTDTYKEIFNRYQKAMDVVMTNKEPSKTKEIEAELEKVGEELFQYECLQYRKVIEGDYPTEVKLFALASTYDWKNYPIEKQLKMLDEYEKEIGKTELIENHRAYLNAPTVLPNQDNRAVPNVGDMYKDVIALDAEGNLHKLSDVLAKNKYVILEFWASWCMPCRIEIPNLKKSYKKYKSKGLEIFSVSLDKSKEEWLQAHKEDNTPWLNFFGENEFNSISAVDYGVMAIPSSFLIAKDGKIVAKNEQLRGDMLETKLAEFLK